MTGEGVVFQDSIFIMIMSITGRAGFPGLTTRLLFDMRSSFCYERTFKSYNVVLEVLLAGKIAPNVIYDMFSGGISPTLFTFGRVMEVCMVNEVDSAFSLLRDMIPSSVVYQTLVHAMFGASRVDDALKLLEEMFVMDDVNTFNDIIIGLCRVHEAAKLVDRMIILGFSPDKISCGVVMEGVCKTGEGDEASCPVQYFDQWVVTKIDKMEEAVCVYRDMLQYVDRGVGCGFI